MKEPAFTVATLEPMVREKFWGAFSYKVGGLTDKLTPWHVASVEGRAGHASRLGMSEKVTPRSVPVTVIAIPPATGPVGAYV